jgi:hypothetical protein
MILIPDNDQIYTYTQPMIYSLNIQYTCAIICIFLFDYYSMYVLFANKEFIHSICLFPNWHKFVNNKNSMLSNSSSKNVFIQVFPTIHMLCYINLIKYYSTLENREESCCSGIAEPFF